MDKAVWEWIGQQIATWRGEAEQGRRPDLEALRGAVRKVGVSGVPEGLVAYVVLGCEWLFRVRKVTDADVAKIIGRLQEGFSKSLGDEHLGYLVTEALRASVSKRIKSEGRIVVPYGLYLPMESPLLRSLFPALHEGKEKPTRPDRIAPGRRGALPWPAPWMAALIVKRLVEQTGMNGVPLGLNLAEALLGKHRSPAKIDLRTREGNLGNEFLGNLAKDFADSFKDLFRDRILAENGEGSRPADQERDWPTLLKKKLLIFTPHSTFPGSPQLVQRVLLAGARPLKAR